MSNKEYLQKKKTKSIIIYTSVIIILYILWSIKIFESGINLKNSFIDRIAVMILIIIAFTFSLYWGIILLKKSFNKWPEKTLIITLIIIALIIIWAILIGDTKGGGSYWGTYQYDTNF